MVRAYFIVLAITSSYCLSFIQVVINLGLDKTLWKY